MNKKASLVRAGRRIAYSTLFTFASFSFAGAREKSSLPSNFKWENFEQIYNDVGSRRRNLSPYAEN